MSEWHEGLTEKQRKFCENFTSNGGNASGAAADAGYSVPSVQGHDNLENHKVKAALETLRQETTSAAIATREERQSFFSLVMRDTNEDMKHRLKAGELLSKCQGDFIKRTEITGKDGSPLGVVSSEPMTSEEWAAKHGTPSA